MQTFIEPSLANTSKGKEADRILRKCVHCGFCTATCPTYQVLGDDLDSPRGRIYLIKSLLEGEPVSNETLTHLDRCLTCRACESTCPSGVEYGHLLDIGRQQAKQKIQRPIREKLLRFLLLKTLPYKRRFGLLFSLGQLGRLILPARIKKLIPKQPKESGLIVNTKHQHRVILFAGCVQPALSPSINQATAKVLDYLGVSVVELNNEQCCGALSHHLDADEQALAFMKNNIDLFYAEIKRGAEKIISTASGCGVHIKDYGYYFKNDEQYSEKAKTVSSLTLDIAEFLQKLDIKKIEKKTTSKVAFQSPCTLQHGQKISGVTEKLLQQLGFTLSEVPDAHLCCGSAGTYSLLQKDLSSQLQQNKITHLMSGKPEKILTANIGCLHHLQQVSPVPVKHWIEEVAALIQ